MQLRKIVQPKVPTAELKCHAATGYLVDICHPHFLAGIKAVPIGCCRWGLTRSYVLLDYEVPECRETFLKTKDFVLSAVARRSKIYVLAGIFKSHNHA
jgi:hypothetical protein